MKTDLNEFDIAAQVVKVIDAARELERMVAAHLRAERRVTTTEHRIATAEARLQVAKLDLERLVREYVAQKKEKE